MLGPPGYFAVTTPWVVTVSPTIGDVSVSVPWIWAIENSAGSASTLMLNSTASVADVESVTVAVTTELPGAEGAPVITPSDDSVMPAGRPVTFQLYGPVPPLASRLISSIGTPTKPFTSAGSVASSGPPTTTVGLSRRPPC